MGKIMRYGNNKTDYVIWFTLSNGRTYYVGEGFVFLSIKDNIDFELFKTTTRKYTHKGAKIITNKLWNQIFTCGKEEENGGHIIKSSMESLESVEKRLKYYTNNKFYFNHTL